MSFNQNKTTSQKSIELLAFAYAGTTNTPELPHMTEFKFILNLGVLGKLRHHELFRLTPSKMQPKTKKNEENF